MSVRLIAITDPGLPPGGGWVEAAVAAVAAGVPGVLLRAKGEAPGVVEAAGRRLQAACAASGARLFIHSELELAARLGAGGLHLASDGPPSGAVRRAMASRLGSGALLSRSCHGLEEVRAAAVDGVDVIYVSPVFAPTSKRLEGPVLGLEGLRAACALAPGRVVALGGITPERASACMEAGAAGVAAIGGLWSCGAVLEVVARWRAALGGDFSS